MTPDYISPQEYCERTGLSIATVHRYLKAGRVPHAQPGGPRGRILIPTEALDLGQVGSPARTGQNTAADPRGPHASGTTGRPGPVPAWRRDRAR